MVYDIGDLDWLYVKSSDIFLFETEEVLEKDKGFA